MSVSVTAFSGVPGHGAHAVGTCPSRHFSWIWEPPLIAQGMAVSSLVLGVAAPVLSRTRGHRYRRVRHMFDPLQHAVVSSQATSPLAETIVAWVRQSTKDEDERLHKALADALRTVRADADAWKAVEASASSTLQKMEQRLREDNRTLRDLLGESVAESLERSIATGLSEGFTREDIQAALRTPAVERAIGAILKDGIFEFIQTVDILGQAVNRLPFLGPLRQQVIEGLRNEVERVLGNQINAFLGRYTRLAAEQSLLPFLTADSNKAVLAQSAQQVARYVLSRKLSELVPPPPSAVKLREETIAGLGVLDPAKVDEAGSAARKLIRQALKTNDIPAVGAANLPVYKEIDMQLQRHLSVELQHAAANGGGSTDGATSFGGQSTLVDDSFEQADKSKALAAKMLNANTELAALPESNKRRLEARIASVLQEELHNAAGG